MNIISLTIHKILTVVPILRPTFAVFTIIAVMIVLTVATFIISITITFDVTVIIDVVYVARALLQTVVIIAMSYAAMTVSISILIQREIIGIISLIIA